MGISTKYPAINIKKRCSYIRYGQFRNENLHPYLGSQCQYRSTTCDMSATEIVIYRGNFTVQDFAPRNFYLTFGFECDWPKSYPLQGLVYNISFINQSNDINSCMQYSEKFHTNACTRFYNETSLPNLIGEEHLDHIIEYFDLYKAY